MSKFKYYLNEGKDSEDKFLTSIVDFFSENPNPPDDDVHDLAEKLGLEPDDFESKIYSVLGSLFGAGNSIKKKITEKDVDKNELKMGMKIEMEHTTNKLVAKKIALDHLAEFPDYYTRLAKMEKEAEKK